MLIALHDEKSHLQVCEVLRNALQGFAPALDM